VLCIHETSNRTIAQLLRGALEAEGIPAFVQGEHLAPLQGQLPAGVAAQYRVCIVDSEQLPAASHFARRWLDAQLPSSAEPWTCRRCGERHEAHFASCWKCGAESDGG
jgi:putative signal transducing protein